MKALLVALAVVATLSLVTIALAAQKHACVSQVHVRDSAWNRSRPERLRKR